MENGLARGTFANNKDKKKLHSFTIQQCTQDVAPRDMNATVSAMLTPAELQLYIQLPNLESTLRVARTKFNTINQVRLSSDLDQTKPHDPRS